MHSRRRFWWATRVALGSLVVSGCATSGALPDLEGLPGKISGRVGRLGVVIAAPHGIGRLDENLKARRGAVRPQVRVADQLEQDPQA